MNVLKHLLPLVFSKAICNTITTIALGYFVFHCYTINTELLLLVLLASIGVLYEMGLTEKFFKGERYVTTKKGKILKNVITYKLFFYSVVIPSVIWLSILTWFNMTGSEEYFGEFGMATIFFFSIQALLNILALTYFLATKNFWLNTKGTIKRSKAKLF